MQSCPLHNNGNKAAVEQSAPGVGAWGTPTLAKLFSQALGQVGMGRQQDMSAHPGQAPCAAQPALQQARQLLDAACLGQQVDATTAVAAGPSPSAEVSGLLAAGVEGWMVRKELPMEYARPEGRVGPASMQMAVAQQGSQQVQHLSCRRYHELRFTTGHMSGWRGCLPCSAGITEKQPGAGCIQASEVCAWPEALHPS